MKTLLSVALVIATVSVVYYLLSAYVTQQLNVLRTYPNCFPPFQYMDGVHACYHTPQGPFPDLAESPDKLGGD